MRGDVTRRECGVQRRVVRQATSNGDHVGMLQEHEAAVAVVIGERTERLGTERHLRVELESPIEHAQ